MCANFSFENTHANLTDSLLDANWLLYRYHVVDRLADGVLPGHRTTGTGVCRRDDGWGYFFYLKTQMQYVLIEAQYGITQKLEVQCCRIIDEAIVGLATLWSPLFYPCFLGVVVIGLHCRRIEPSHASFLEHERALKLVCALSYRGAAYTAKQNIQKTQHGANKTICKGLVRAMSTLGTQQIATTIYFLLL